MSKSEIERGSHPADGHVSITIHEKGPYLVYGQPPLTTQFIQLNAEYESWRFQAGRRFPTDAEPTALCRCGASKRKPYCDGSHTSARWDPTLTARDETLPDEIEETCGQTLTLSDRAQYCTFARFCHAAGDAWTLTEHSDDPTSRRLAIREASMCPGGRLTARDPRTGEPFEPHYEPSLGLIEDPATASSGGLWVRGGIPLRSETGTTYAIRNRMVLCRCGQSANKPFCDGTHAAIKWQDHLDTAPEEAAEPRTETEAVPVP